MASKGFLEAVGRVDRLLKDATTVEVTVQGKKMYAISRTSLRKAKDELDDLSANVPLGKGDEFSELQSRFERMSTLNKQSQEKEKEALRLAQDLKKELEDKGKKADQYFAQLKEQNDDCLSTIEDYKIQIAEKNLSLSRMQSQINGAQKWDPDTNSAVHQQLAQCEKELEQLRQYKDTADKEHVQLVAESQKARVDMAKLKKDQEEAWRMYNELKNTQKMADSSAPIVAREVTIHNQWLDAALGKNALSWLSKLDKVNRSNLRDRAFHLIQIASHSEARKVSALKVLFERVFQLIREGVSKAFMALDSWITMIENDIRSMSLKAFKFYREELEKIVASMKAKASQVAQTVNEKHKKYRQKSNLYDFFSSLITPVTSRVERGFYRVRSTLKRGLKWLSSFSLFARVPKTGQALFEEDVLFDSEIEGDPLKQEEPVVHDNYASAAKHANDRERPSKPRLDKGKGKAK